MPSGALSVLAAVQELNSRCTVSQVADRLHANDEKERIRQELSELLCDTGGRFETNESREVVYIFPKHGLRQRALARRHGLRIYTFIWDIAVPACLKLLRYFFGVFIIFSFVLGLLVLILVSVSRRQHGGGLHQSPFFWFFVLRRNPFFGGWQGQQHEYELPGGHTGQGARSSTTFIDEVFSFLFGNGGHPGPSEKERWEMQARHIEYNGGVIAAETLKPLQRYGYKRSAWLLKVLAKLGGEPVASDDGKLVYRFSRLAKGVKHGRMVKVFVERRWVFSDKSVLLPLTLGCANLFVLLLVQQKMQRYHDFVMVDLSLSSLVIVLFNLCRKPLYVYAFLYLAVPLLRYGLLVVIANRFIDIRNRERREVAAEVEQRGKDESSDLHAQIAFANRTATAEL